MSPDRALLYFGTVVHRRLAPVRHGFRYGVFYLRLRVDQMQRRWPRLISHNGWNLFSFHDADHGPRDGSALLPWIRNLLTQHGLACA
ncbi:MAG: DUF1365 domain-containing protein, partial [Betaproteobacteria bacterium]|nr:DUF1365 domain-containing protein [Betaproteobacteria bacterium]